MAEKKLKDLSRQTYSVEDVGRIVQELSRSEDRETAIVGAALVEAELEKLLVKNMVSLQKGEYKELFMNNGPLATSWARAKVAAALNIISRELHNDITQLMSIRNTFAHCARNLTFSDETVSEACEELTVIDEAALRGQIGGLSQVTEGPNDLIVVDKFGFIGFKTSLIDNENSRSRYLNCISCVWFALIAKSNSFPVDDTPQGLV